MPLQQSCSWAQKVLDLDYFKQDDIPFSDMSILFQFSFVDGAVQHPEFVRFASIVPNEDSRQTLAIKEMSFKPPLDTFSAKYKITVNATTCSVHRNRYLGNELVRISDGMSGKSP